MRAANRSSAHQVLAFLLDQSMPASRPEIASSCALSRPTVFAAIQQLENTGLVKEAGQRSGTPGRSATLYEVASEAGILAAVDIGGSNVRVAITDLRGKPVVEAHEPTARPGGSAIAAQSVALLRDVLARSGAEATSLFKIAVSVPGVVAADGSTVHYASNIDQFEPFDFRTPFCRALDRPVILDNNVNLAALGERWHGAARNLKTFVVVSVGAGIGAGVIHDGRLLRGAHGAAGEVAFLPPNGSHRKVDTTAHDEAGGLSLLQAARARSDWLRPVPVTVEELFLRAAEGEPASVALFEDECARVASVIASVCAVIDPETVILTGGVGANEHLITSVRQLVEEMVLFPPSLIRSGLGERASLMGAVYIAARSTKRELMQTVTDSLSAQGTT